MIDDGYADTLRASIAARLRYLAQLRLVESIIAEHPERFEEYAVRSFLIAAIRKETIPTSLTFDSV